MSILRAGIKSGTFIEQMEGLVRLCSAKRINIRPGTRACTNGKDTIYLPWLPNDATEDDKLRFFNFAAHEQSHFYGESDVPKMSKNHTRHHFENAVDDMRCERLQEEEYPGLKQYRAPFLSTYARDLLAEEFQTASASTNIVQFLHAVQSYAYLKVRFGEIGVTEPINANDEVLQAYDKYVADLIPRIKTHRTFEEALELGGQIYDRMKDLIREAMEKKTPPPPEPASSKPKETKNEDDSDGRDDSGDDTESQETRGAKESGDDNTEGESKDSGSTGDDTDETDGDTDESSEEKSGGDKNSEGEDDPKDGETGEKDKVDKKDTDDDEEDTDSDKGESRDREECDSEEDSKEDGSAGDRTENESEDLSEETEGSDGDSGTDESPSSGGDSKETDSEEDDVGRDGVSDDGVPGEKGKTEDDATEDSGDGEATEETDSPENKKHRGSPSEPTEDHEPETEPDSAEGDDDDNPDPVREEYEEAKREWDERITEAVEEVLREVEDHADELKTINEENKEAIDEHAADSDSPYMVHPGVVDCIEYNRSVTMCEAEMIKNRGLKMLGSAGTRLTRVFVAESYPRHVHNQYHGRFDMRSFIADPADRRTDIYSRKMGARLDKAAVSLMIDNSGSMESRISPIYCIISGLLHYLGHARIPTEAVGFTAGTACSDDYRDVPVHLTIVKKFEDPYDSAVMQRCAKPFHMEQNAEVDCLRYMVPRLMARPETKKVLFILGDGLPEIGSYLLNRKLAAAYKEYIRLCKEAGVIVFGFGIKCDLRWVFGEDFVSVGTEDVGDQLLSKLTEVLNRPPVSMKRLAA